MQAFGSLQAQLCSLENMREGCLPQVLTGNDERVATWRQLAQSWQDMWLKWDSEQGSRKADAQADVGDEKRMAFVNSLLAQVSTFPCTSTA